MIAALIVSTAVASGPAAAKPSCRDHAGCVSAAEKAALAGRCREAFDLYSSAIRFDGSIAETWHQRAILRKAGKDERGAALDFTEAKRLGLKKTALETPAQRFGKDWSCKKRS